MASDNLSPLTLRLAQRDDIAAMSRVLTASIVTLCAIDHRDDEAAIAAWTRNKTPAGTTVMLDNPDLQMFVAERDGQLLAVGAIGRSAGTIALNYVDPNARFGGVSTALLARLEQALVDLGHLEGRLESTTTARGFYESRGWLADGPQATGRVVNGYPMRKRLNS